MASRPSKISVRSLKFEKWPEIDRTTWKTAMRPGDPFTAAGLAAHWRPATRDMVADCYGEWLAFLDRRNKLGVQVDPAERLKREWVENYIKCMQGRVRNATVTIRIDSLVRAISVMAPLADITWLRRILQHLKRQTRDRKPKIDRMRPSLELYRLGLKLMQEAEADRSPRSMMAAVQYCDGLMIAFLAARPLRLSTFVALELECHIARRGDAYWLDVPGDLTKTGQPIEVPLPTDLTAYLERYITVYRPALVGGHDTNRLWISQFEAPISGSGVGVRIRWRTRQEFGTSITPQLFRDCAATSVAIQDPDHVYVSAVLLGHKTLRTTERYYNQAQLLHASRHYHAQIRRLRGPLRRSATPP